MELHTHGSRAVINGVLDALASVGAADGGGEAGGAMVMGGRVRLAERGEFTQRAYGNGRMDLTGVEGLADLIAADTAAQRKQVPKKTDLYIWLIMCCFGYRLLLLSCFPERTLF